MPEVDSIKFFKGFLEHPRAVGAVLPSSQYLAQAMLKKIDWASTRAIAEIGPGTGPFTQAILERHSQTTQFFAVELDETFAGLLQSRYPDADMIQGDASLLREYCDQRHIERLDAIVSGLPWAIFPEDLQQKLLSAILDTLAPGGKFSTFAYVHGLWMPAGRRFRGLLHKQFRSVETSPIVWRNAPPAIVYHCQK